MEPLLIQESHDKFWTLQNQLEAEFRTIERQVIEKIKQADSKKQFKDDEINIINNRRYNNLGVGTDAKEVRQANILAKLMKTKKEKIMDKLNEYEEEDSKYTKKSNVTNGIEFKSQKNMKKFKKKLNHVNQLQDMYFTNNAKVNGHSQGKYVLAPNNNNNKKKKKKKNRNGVNVNGSSYF